MVDMGAVLPSKRRRVTLEGEPSFLHAVLWLVRATGGTITLVMAENALLVMQPPVIEVDRAAVVTLPQAAGACEGGGRCSGGGGSRGGSSGCSTGGGPGCSYFTPVHIPQVEH
ncbi:hypothetical protein PLESTM_000631100 [Pleodorina starrii]|nr:hypothetical protein PLESTM_000631100 [Pleodorina starrii]